MHMRGVKGVRGYAYPRFPPGKFSKSLVIKFKKVYSHAPRAILSKKH
jgi:hypothetical protein